MLGRNFSRCQWRVLILPEVDASTGRPGRTYTAPDGVRKFKHLQMTLGPGCVCVWVCVEQLTFERGSSSSTLRAISFRPSMASWTCCWLPSCTCGTASRTCFPTTRIFGSRAASKGSGSESQSFSHFPARLVVLCVSTRSGLTACFYVMCLGHPARDQSASVFFTSLVANGTTAKTGIGAARAFAGASLENSGCHHTWRVQVSACAHAK